MSPIVIHETDPPLGSHNGRYMLEQVGATVKLGSRHPAEALRVQLWTNALSKFNSEGDWHGIDLDFAGKDAEGRFIFQGSFLPTSVGEYRFTYRAGLESEPEQWHWAEGVAEDGYLVVRHPSPDTEWAQGVSAVEILPGVYVGNLIAASDAESLGFEAVLNLAEELTVTYGSGNGIASKKIGLSDGAHNPIPEDRLHEAVEWVGMQVNSGKKVLLHCRAGIGRSGSVGIAYCFRQHPDWSYEETLQHVWSKKSDIYPHKHLQRSVERLFPRMSRGQS